MTWLIEILTIYLEEQLLIKYNVIKYLILLKIQNVMDIKKVLLQWGGVRNENISNQELVEELFEKTKSILGVLILGC